MKKIILIAGIIILVLFFIFFIFGYVFYKFGRNATKLYCDFRYYERNY